MENKMQFQEKIKRRELLRDKIQRHQIYITGFLKDSDIDSIVANLVEKRIFLKQLAEDILLKIRTRHEKAEMLVDNIMRCDEKHMLHFLDLIQYVMPVVYEEITGNTARTSLVDDEVYSKITGQSLVIRRSIKTLEDVKCENYKISEKDFEDLKRSLLLAEKQIERMWNAAVTVDGYVAVVEEKKKWKGKYDELMEKFTKSENEWNEKLAKMNAETTQLKAQIELLEAQVSYLRSDNQSSVFTNGEAGDEDGASKYPTGRSSFEDENPYGSLQSEFIENLKTSFSENKPDLRHPLKVTKRREQLPGTGQNSEY